MIPAHYGENGRGSELAIFPTAVDKDGGTPLPVLSAVPREDPFEWTVFFRCAEGADMMQWKISKGEMPSVRIPERLALPENAVMLLRS